MMGFEVVCPPPRPVKNRLPLPRPPYQPFPNLPPRPPPPHPLLPQPLLDGFEAITAVLDVISGVARDDEF